VIFTFFSATHAEILALVSSDLGIPILAPLFLSFNSSKWFRPKMGAKAYLEIFYSGSKRYK